MPIGLKEVYSCNKSKKNQRERERDSRCKNDAQEQDLLLDSSYRDYILTQLYSSV